MHDRAISNIRRTEMDGLQAVWRSGRHRIEILAVHRTADNRPVLLFTPADCPDLAQVREQWPRLERLWDAVRHEFWMQFGESNKHDRQELWMIRRQAR